MPQVFDQSRFWDVASEKASPAESEVRQIVTALLTPQQITGRAVLDAGCGNGDYTAFFLNARAARVTALDVSPGSLHAANGKAPGAALCQASLGELPFEQSAFDVIWSWGMLHYVPDPPAALREVGRVLKPGGAAVIHARGAHALSRLEVFLQRILSRSPGFVQQAILVVGTAALSFVTRLRTGKSPQAHTPKSVRQKLQEKLLAPGKQWTFTLNALRSGFGPGFIVTQADPPVASLLGRNLSITVIVRKQS